MDLSKTEGIQCDHFFFVGWDHGARHAGRVSGDDALTRATWLGVFLLIKPDAKYLQAVGHQLANQF
ncbi:hypothetical protein D3C86_2062740 [compost metagenome]